MGHASFGDFRLPLVWWVAAALVAMVTGGAFVGGVAGCGGQGGATLSGAGRGDLY